MRARWFLVLAVVALVLGVGGWAASRPTSTERAAAGVVESLSAIDGEPAVMPDDDGDERWLFGGVVVAVALVGAAAASRSRAA